jgi:hypothetical protein
MNGVSVMDGKLASYDSPGYLVRPRSRLVVPGWRLDNGEVARFKFGEAAVGYARRMAQTNDNVGAVAAAFFKEKKVRRLDRPGLLPDSEGGVAPLSRENRDIPFSIRRPPPDAARFWAAQRTGQGRGLGAYARKFIAAMRHLGGSVGQKSAEADNARPPSNAQPGALIRKDTDDVAVVFGDRAVHRVTQVPFERASFLPDAEIRIRYDTRRGLERRGIGCKPAPGRTPSA